MPALPRQINRRIGQAMGDYRMLANHDRVLIAVSGGIDSLVLCALLDSWRRKAPIDYQLLAVHLDMGFGTDERLQVQRQLERLRIPSHIEETDFGRQALENGDHHQGCHGCATRRRRRLFELARLHGCNKLALGHHQEDLIETFFLNLLYSGNLSTMVPAQPLFQGQLTIIRPLAYLLKAEVRELGQRFGVSPVANPCPLAEKSKRTTVRELLARLYQEQPQARANIFAALANPRFDYLLRPARR